MKVFLIILVSVRKMERREQLLLKVVLEPEKQLLQLIYWLNSQIERYEGMLCILHGCCLGAIF